MSNLSDRYQFRGKRLDNGEWAYGSLLVLGDRRFIIPSEELLDGEKPSNIYWSVVRKTCEVDPKTVGQYTGTRDRSGTKVFEGDIVAYFPVTGGGYVDKVRFVDGEFRVGENSVGYATWHHCKGKVFGNIHDNQELMGGEKDG